MNLEKFLADKVEMFATFPPEQLAELVAVSRAMSFEAGEAVIEFGEQGHFLGILLDGEAELSLTDNSGEAHRLAVLRTGDLFGAASLMTEESAPADVIGLTRCHALLIPAEKLWPRLATLPGAIASLSRLISRRMKLLTSSEIERESSARFLARQEDPYGFTLQSPRPLKLLALNATPHWIRYQLYDTADSTFRAGGRIEGLGGEHARHTGEAGGHRFSERLEEATHPAALEAIFTQLQQRVGLHSSSDLSAVGHRVVHGGERFNSSVLITAAVLTAIEELAELAPLDNPVAAAVIRETRRLLPETIPQIAVFDTAFHQTLPAYAYLYALPREYREKHHIRRYGFHGLSHRYAALKAAEFLKKPYNALEIVTCHLGSGTSLCAIDHGRSVDTSMGFTPTGGLIMATRPGSLDPGALLHLIRKENLSPDGLETLLYRRSGLLGLSDYSGNLLAIEERAASRADDKAILALKTYAYQLRKYIGAYMAAMGGLDVLVFTGRKGTESALARSLACQGLECMGIHLDPELNAAPATGEIRELSTPASRVKILIIPNREELMIAREIIKVLEKEKAGHLLHNRADTPVPLEISAHHIHLSREHVEALFGPGYQLKPKAELSQPGQFACEETVTLSGPRGQVQRVRILGPERRETQVEIAMTEQFILGIHPPVRQSGDLEGTPGITIIGPRGSITTSRGVICAMRHIHMTPADALAFGLRDRDVVRVRVEGDRELVFGDVLVRVKPNYHLAMHLDTDEANAAHISNGTPGYIESIQSRGEG